MNHCCILTLSQLFLEVQVVSTCFNLWGSREETTRLRNISKSKFSDFHQSSTSKNPILGIFTSNFILRCGDFRQKQLQDLQMVVTAPGNLTVSYILNVPEADASSSMEKAPWFLPRKVFETGTWTWKMWKWLGSERSFFCKMAILHHFKEKMMIFRGFSLLFRIHLFMFFFHVDQGKIWDIGILRSWTWTKTNDISRIIAIWVQVCEW